MNIDLHLSRSQASKAPDTCLRTKRGSDGAEEDGVSVRHSRRQGGVMGRKMGRWCEYNKKYLKYSTL